MLARKVRMGRKGWMLIPIAPLEPMGRSFKIAPLPNGSACLLRILFYLPDHPNHRKILFIRKPL